MMYTDIVDGVDLTYIRWSRPIEGSPNLKLPLSAVEVQYSECSTWFPATNNLNTPVVRHRVMMDQPIRWNNQAMGDSPAPLGWEVEAVFADGDVYSGRVGDIAWCGPWIVPVAYFTLTDDSED